MDYAVNLLDFFFRLKIHILYFGKFHELFKLSSLCFFPFSYLSPFFYLWFWLLVDYSFICHPLWRVFFFNCVACYSFLKGFSLFCWFLSSLECILCHHSKVFSGFLSPWIVWSRCVKRLPFYDSILSRVTLPGLTCFLHTFPGLWKRRACRGSGQLLFWWCFLPTPR